MFNRNNSGGGGCVCACVHAHVFIKVSKQHIYVDLFFLKSISSLWTVRSSKIKAHQNKEKHPQPVSHDNLRADRNRTGTRTRTVCSPESKNNIYRSTNQQYEFGFMSPNIFSLKTLKTNTSTCDGVTKERSHECTVQQVRWVKLVSRMRISQHFSPQQRPWIPAAVCSRLILTNI